MDDRVRMMVSRAPFSRALYARDRARRSSRPRGFATRQVVTTLELVCYFAGQMIVLSLYNPNTRQRARLSRGRGGRAHLTRAAFVAQVQ